MKNEELQALESMIREYRSKDYYTLLSLSGLKTLSKQYMMARIKMETEMLKQREKEFFKEFNGDLLDRVLAKEMFNELYERIDEARFTFEDDERRERYNNLSNQNISVANREMSTEYKKENFDQIVSIDKFKDEEGNIDFTSAFARLIKISKDGNNIQNRGLENINGRAYDIYHLLNMHHYREDEINSEKIDSIYNEIVENANKLFGEEIDLYRDKLESLNIAKMILKSEDLRAKYDIFLKKYEEHLQNKEVEKEEVQEKEEEEKVEIIEIRKNSNVDQKYAEVKKIIEERVDKEEGNYQKVEEQVDEIINKVLIEDALDRDPNQSIEEHGKEIGNILVLRNYPRYYGEKIYPKLKEGKTREEIDRERITKFLKEKRPTFLNYKTEAADVMLEQNFLEDYSEVINEILGLEKGYKENIDFLDEI